MLHVTHLSAAAAPTPAVLPVSRCQPPVCRLHHAVVSISFVCRARSSRLQLLGPDPADAVVDADPTLYTAVDEGGSDPSAAAAASLEAYPCRPSGATAAAATTASAWTASDDADIDDADWALSTAGSQQQQQQQQRGRQYIRTAVQLSLPLLAPLNPGAPQQQHPLPPSSAHARGSSAITASAANSSSAEQHSIGLDSAGAAVSWKALQLPGAATAGMLAATAEAPMPHTAPDDAAPAAAAAAATAVDGSGDVGSFFGSRVSMLLQLKQQQLLVQRQHVLAKKRQQLYRYTVAQDGSSIQQQTSSAAISPLKQTKFALAKKQPLQQQQQQQPALYSNPRSLPAGGGAQAAGLPTGEEQQQQQLHAAALPIQPDPQLPLGAHQPRQQQPAPPPTPTAAAPPAGQAAVPPKDPSRGLCLSAFLYCCSRNEVASLAWQLGLAPSALRFVSRVSDADLVLHVKPGKGQRHYQYEEYRAQAAEKGIPFVDLKNLSLLELQLYLLPVFRLYAGELSPRDLLLRRKRRGPRKRYAAIKLPAARAPK